MKFMALLEALEQHIENCRRIPLSGKLLVDGDEILDFIDQMREALPEEVEEAQQIFRDRDQFMNEAQWKADKMMEDTRAHMTRLVDEHEVNRQAREAAESLVEEARKVADEIRTGADEYADEVLRGIEDVLKQSLESLERTSTTVRRGREEIKRTRGD